MTGPESVREPIRLTVLTGFLGAGKTTVLNRLLREGDVAGIAIVVNEFGEAGIDPLLVETATADGIIELADGCVCCSVRGELVETLVTLATAERPYAAGPLRRVIVETSGVADPGPILVSLMTHPLLIDRFALDGVVAVVDRLNGLHHLRTRNEARLQIAVADRIVLTKADLSPARPGRDDLGDGIASLNPRAKVVVIESGGSLRDSLFDCSLVDPATGRADPARWMGFSQTPTTGAPGHRDGSAPSPAQLHEHEGHEHQGHERQGHERQGHERQGHERHEPHRQHHHGTVRSFSIVEPEPVSFDAVTAFLELLAATQGERILRMKAIVHCRESPERPVVLHGVRGYLHPPARLGTWPSGTPRQTRLVLIGDGLPETYARDLFAAFTGGLRSDAPDRQALETSPLSIANYSFSP